ncbi:hypothetical protein CCONF_03215 [Corynebacterium confusum]|nr:hypothetical protein CCONF_03215 [Corynebacterium confusum]
MRTPRRRSRLASLSALVTAALLGAPTGASAAPTENYRADSYESRTALSGGQETVGEWLERVEAAQDQAGQAEGGAAARSAEDAAAPDATGTKNDNGAASSTASDADAGVPVWGIGAALGGILAAVGASAAAWSSVDWTQVLMFLGSL